MKRWAAEIKCGRETLEAIWEGQKPFLLRSLPWFSQHHCRKKNTKLYIVVRCQLTGYQSSLELIRNGFSTTCQGKITALASSGNLWPQRKPWSSISNQRWNQSSGNVLCLTRKLRQWCQQAGWWSIFYRMKRSTAVGLLKKGHAITRASIDKKRALQPEHCSGTHIHSVQAWLLGVFQLVKHHSWWSYKRCGPLPEGPRWCLLHWMYASASWPLV